MDTKNSPEVWDRLSNESGRAYEAFKVYMYMSPAERSVVGAWREWTENPEAVRPSPFFEGWARDYAWTERAEVGAITGELELLTRLTPDGGGIVVMVRYAGARDLYTVSGSPLRAVSEHPNQREHRAAHERILETLTTPGWVESGNEMPVGLLDG